MPVPAGTSPALRRAYRGDVQDRRQTVPGGRARSAPRREPTATVLLVFGRGVTCNDDGYALTAAGAERVQAAADYVAAHTTAFADAAREGHRPRIVFSGGWAEASDGQQAPPDGYREGDLMLARARAAGLDRYADLLAESRSRSTLENLLHTSGDGLLNGRTFTARDPLGIVSHSWHLPRVRYLAGKVLGLRGPALLEVPAAGRQSWAGWRSERVTRLVARVCFLGVRGAEALVRRERRWIASLRRIERLLRRSPSKGWRTPRDHFRRTG
jgi:hypothetical protein